MSFDYFSDMIAPLKAMFYLLIAGNICFMLSKRKEKGKVSTQKVPEEITHSE